jgi:hypothetical protein
MKKLLLLTYFACSINILLGQTWEYVGNCCIDAPVSPISSSGSEDLDFMDDGTPVVSYFTQTGLNTTARCKKFENGNWVLLADNIPVSDPLQRIDLEIFGNNIYAATLEGSTNLNVWQFNGVSWEPLGSAITANLAFEFEHDNNGELYLFLASSSKVLKYDGSEWIEIWSQNPGSTLSWAGERSLVCDENNDFYFNETTMTPNFSFVTQMMKFDGVNTSPVGVPLYSGGGINGRLAIDQDGFIYNQYTINNTNKIVKMVNNEWEHQIDTTHVLNTIFGFNYIFDSSNNFILQNGMNLYYGNDYSAFPAIDAQNPTIIINDMAVSPGGELYASFGEIAPGSGGDFSVMKYNDSNNIAAPDAGKLSLYPNPTLGNLTISSPDVIQKIAVFELQGKLKIQENYFNQNTLNLNVSQLTQGYYIVEVITQSTIYREKIIIVE